MKNKQGKIVCKNHPEIVLQNQRSGEICTDCVVHQIKMDRMPKEIKQAFSSK